MMKGTIAKGNCLCGAVQIAVSDLSTTVDACHCSMCRKWGGGPYFAITCKDHVHFKGEDYISVYASSDWAERGFCSKCGTHLFYRLKKPNLYELSPGVFDQHGPLNFKHQIFSDEKPDYYEFANKTKTLTGAEVMAKAAPPKNKD